jgi:hypothetical protein
MFRNLVYSRRWIDLLRIFYVKNSAKKLLNTTAGFTDSSLESISQIRTPIKEFYNRNPVNIIHLKLVPRQDSAYFGIKYWQL